MANRNGSAFDIRTETATESFPHDANVAGQELDNTEEQGGCGRPAGFGEEAVYAV